MQNAQGFKCCSDFKAKIDNNSGGYSEAQVVFFSQTSLDKKSHASVLLPILHPSYI
jgi:hypothetical protein